MCRESPGAITLELLGRSGTATGSLRSFVRSCGFADGANLIRTSDRSTTVMRPSVFTSTPIWVLSSDRGVFSTSLTADGSWPPGRPPRSLKPWRVSRQTTSGPLERSATPRSLGWSSFPIPESLLSDPPGTSPRRRERAAQAGWARAGLGEARSHLAARVPRAVHRKIRSRRPLQRPDLGDGLSSVGDGHCPTRTHESEYFREARPASEAE